MGKRSLIAYGMFLLLPVGASAQNTERALTLFADLSFETGWPGSTIQAMGVSRLAMELVFPLSSGDAWHLEYPVSFFLALARKN